MKRSTFLCLATLLLAVALPAAAQKFKPKTIQFKGAPEYSDQELMAAADLKLGVVLSSAEMNDHAKRLMDSGVFDNLTFKFDGVDLVFSLIPNTTLFPLRLENIPLAAGPELDAKLHDRLPLYHGKVPSEGGLLNDVKDALTDMLAAEGIQSVLTATPYTGALDSRGHKGAAISLAITSPPVQVGKIHLQGFTAPPSAANNPPLASPQEDTKVLDILARLASSSYNTEGSKNQIETYLGNYYREKGYLEAAVHATPSPAPLVTAEAIQIPFDVTVAPGSIYRLSGVHLDPAMVVTQAAFDHQANIHPGDIADGPRVRGNWEFIARQYHNKGYMRAAVHNIPTYDRANGTVSFAVTAESGPVYTMGTLKIGNVADDLRNAMIAAWKIPAGAVFNESAVLSYYAMRDENPALGRTFASTNCKYEFVLNDDTHTVDVTLRLEKR
jgi:outer membrane protein insertion porin family